MNIWILDQNVKIDDLHLRRSLLAGYCKLLVFGALPVRAALPVFKNCVQVIELLSNIKYWVLFSYYVLVPNFYVSLQIHTVYHFYVYTYIKIYT